MGYITDISAYKGLPLWVTVGTVLLTTVVFTWMVRRRSVKRTLKGLHTKVPLKLVEKINLSHDTRLFRFELPSPRHVLGLPVGQNIYLSTIINGQIVVRPYTPVTSDDDLGHMDLIVKVYFKNTSPKFPDGGKMSQYMNELPLGETIDCRGPGGDLVYRGGGEFAITRGKKLPPQIFRIRKINLIAGGSGITPILQLIRAVFKDMKDETQLSLVYANKTEDDILCRRELEEIAARHQYTFSVWYTVSGPPTGWAYSTGHIDEDMLKTRLFPPSEDTIVLMCGPPGLITQACIPCLDSLGYSSKLRFIF